MRASLAWDGARLGLSEPVTERARQGRDGLTLVSLRPGDDVALHWDWVCERLDGRRLAHLRRDTAGQLAAVNRDLAVSRAGPVAHLIHGRGCARPGRRRLVPDSTQ